MIIESQTEGRIYEIIRLCQFNEVAICEEFHFVDERNVPLAGRFRKIGPTQVRTGLGERDWGEDHGNPCCVVVRQDYFNQVEALLQPYENSPVECDGFTRIAHTLLTREEIPHQAKIGTLVLSGERWYPHFWIELPGNAIVDYRCRLFVDRDDIPEGVFAKEDSPVEYQGEGVELGILTDLMIQFMVAEVSEVAVNYLLEG